MPQNDRAAHFFEHFALGKTFHLFHLSEYNAFQISDPLLLTATFNPIDLILHQPCGKVTERFI